MGVFELQKQMVCDFKNLETLENLDYADDDNKRIREEKVILCIKFKH